MAKGFAAIDIGTTKICSILAELDETGDMRIMGVGAVPSKGMQKGSVVDIDQAKQQIQESVKIAQNTCGIEMKSAYISITGRHLRSVNNRGTVGILRRNRVVAPSDAKRAIQTAANIAIPSDRSLLQVIPRIYILDGQVEVKDPVGMHGFRLDADAHLVTGATAAVRNLTTCVRGAKIGVLGLIPQAIASSEAVLTDDEKNAGVLLVDVGGGTTDIAYFKHGSIYYSAVIPIAGNQITRDLSISLAIPFEVAEEAKIRYADVTPGYEEEETTISIGGDGYTIPLREFQEIVRARMEEIFRLFFTEISSQEFEFVAPAGLVLVGGTANTPGIEALGEEISGFPTQVRAPREVSGPADLLYDPAYTASMGLLFWGAKHQGHQVWKVKEPRPGIIQALRQFFTRGR
jgi:cell division protein FtsA